MPFNVIKEDELEYLIRAKCMNCEAAVTLITNEEDLVRMTKKNALFLGPCPGCGAAFLRVVEI